MGRAEQHRAKVMGTERFRIYWQEGGKMWRMVVGREGEEWNLTSESSLGDWLDDAVVSKMGKEEEEGS